MKDVPSIELPERALVAAGMSLHWKAERHDKPVYVEDDKSELTNLGLGPESKKKKRVPATTVAPNKFDTLKADVLKDEKKKGTHLVSDPWCDYIVVSDTLEGLAPVAVWKPKPEPRDTTDIPVANLEDPIDVESSPEPLLRIKAVKRKQPESEATAQPTKKITRKRISKKGNLDAFVAKLCPGGYLLNFCFTILQVNMNFSFAEKPVPSVRVESSYGTKTVEVEVKKAVEVEKLVEVELEAEKTVEAQTTDVGATKPKSPEVVAHGPERGKSILEEEKLKQGHTFSDWQVCRDWLQGIFPPTKIKFQEERSHDHTYRSYLEETASSTSTTHRIVREWRNMHKEWDAFEASKKEVAEEKSKVAMLRAKLDADQAKFVSEQRTEEWSPIGWKKKVEAEATQLAKARKRWKEICEKDNNEKRFLRADVNNLKADIEKLKKGKAEAETARDEARSHREQSEQREVQTCVALALRNKEIEELTSLLTDQEQTKAELESAKKRLAT
ncbi:hypothetical protein Hanom_Chr11g01015201 [Helianthus anomalus]